MRVAAIYDIHGNLPALEAVLGEIRSEGVDLVVVGGDVVPGPMPQESVSALLDLSVPVRFFAELTYRQLKRLAVNSVAQLIDTITRYIDRRNENPRPFVWTASPTSIIAKVKKAKETLATQH